MATKKKKRAVKKPAKKVAKKPVKRAIKRVTSAASPTDYRHLYNDLRRSVETLVELLGPYQGNDPALNGVFARLDEQLG